jgi:hypothetical protein
MAVGAEQDALIQFWLDLLEGSAATVGKSELFSGRVRVVKFETAEIAVIPTPMATAPHVGDNLSFEPLLPLDSLLIRTDFAVVIDLSSITTTVELGDFQDSPTARTRFHAAWNLLCLG